MKYIYLLKGGCGCTSINLNLDIDNMIFEMNYKSKWMGGNNKNIDCFGKIVKNEKSHKILVIEKINDINLVSKLSIFQDVDYKVTNAMINIYDLHIDIRFSEWSKELEGMVMGGCNVNEDCTYNSILNISHNFYNCEEEEIFKDIDNIFYMYKLKE